MDSFAFMSAVAVPLKSSSVTAACSTTFAQGRPNAVALRRTAFAGFAIVSDAGYSLHANAYNTTRMMSGDVITQGEVQNAQLKWANGVVKIGSLKNNVKECEAFTDQFLNERYVFNTRSVLFKPTKCAVQQFRPTKPEAFSYFIAGNKKMYAEDGGFAVTPWTNIRFENSDFIFAKDRAFAMGNYFFTDTSGGETKVEYTFGYTKVNGDLKIDLHHSSLPFPMPA